MIFYLTPYIRAIVQMQSSPDHHTDEKIVSVSELRLHTNYQITIRMVWMQNRTSSAIVYIIMKCDLIHGELVIDYCYFYSFHWSLLTAIFWLISFQTPSFHLLIILMTELSLSIGQILEKRAFGTKSAAAHSVLCSAENCCLERFAQLSSSEERSSAIPPL